MRRGRGQRGRDRAADRRRVDRLGGELPDGPPRGQHVGGAQPEHVVRGGPDQRGRAGPVGPGHQPGQAAHDHGGQLRGLPLDQVGRGRDLVRHGGHRDLEQVAERVRLAAMVPQRRQARHPDRGVGLPGAPRPAHGVGDDHPDADPAALAQRLAQPPRRAVRVLGQQHHRARRGVRVVHARGREHQAVPGLHDAGLAPPRHHPDRLGVDGLLPVRPDDPALGLADDLRGHHHDVAVPQVRNGIADQPPEVGARLDLRQAGHAGDREPGHRVSSAARASAVRAISAVAARSVM